MTESERTCIALWSCVRCRRACVLMTTPRPHWKKVCTSACSIDHSSTASLGTSTVPEYLIEQQTRTVVQQPHVPHPPPTPQHHYPSPLPWPPKILPCSSVWKSHVACGPPAQVRLFCADCFKGFCLHQQKIGGDNFLEFSLGLPLPHFAHSWLALSLILSLRKGWYLRGLTFPEEHRWEDVRSFLFAHAI